MNGKPSTYTIKTEETDKKRFSHTTPTRLLKSILSGYAQVFFSTQWYVGLIFLAATLVIPAQGAAGLFALLLSNLWARLLGFPQEHVEEGYFSYNALLTGLALGLTYQVNTAFLVMILVATLLGVIIAAMLRSAFEYYLFIPVLCTPFVLTTWIVIASGRQFQGLVYRLEPHTAGFITGILPDTVDFFVRSVGAAFFQVNTLSGILVTAGLLIFSRQAFIFAITGLASGSVIFILLGGNLAGLTSGLAGFNFALTAIAVGGIWTVPGLGSFFLAAAGGAICAIFVSAAAFFFNPLGLPVLAFPFVATTSVLIYALKNRRIISRFKTVHIPESTPEKNLKRHKNVKARFVTGESPVFNLPVNGQWSVTQGVNGEHTHRELWEHAWDFEITDETGKTYQREGSVARDFYAFNMPVLSPADGKVITVVNHIEDNPIGQVNPEHNWGNIVIIWHYASVYTSVCHLKKDSITVNEGEVIRSGQIIGRVGNSGRSPVPHLHFQVQFRSEIGAPTIPSELRHYVNVQDSEYVYHTNGVPKKGDKIQPLETDNNVFDTASFPLGRTWAFDVRSGVKHWEEIWETDIDFAGHRYLICRKQNARIQFYVSQKVLLLLDYEGPRNTGLHWFFTGLPRLPMTTGNVCWKDELPGELMLSKPAKFFFDLCEPFFSPARVSSSSRFIKGAGQFCVETELDTTGLLAPNRYRKINAVSIFSRYRGLNSLNITAGGSVLFELKQRD